MSYKYSWTVTSKYYYDQTLTTALLKNSLDDMLDSSGSDTHFYRLSNMGNLSLWPADREKQHDTGYHHEIESEEPATDPPRNSTYEFYENFKLATGLNFAELRSSAAGLWSYGGIPNGLGLADNTSAGNITFDSNGGIILSGGNTLAQDITFIDGGEVLFTDAGSGTQTLTGLLASKDLEYIDMGFVERGGSSILSAAQSSSQAKYWNNPFGWMTVVQFLKDNRYRVLCIDKEKVHGVGLKWNFIPYGAEDFTGDIPLQERVDLIKDADFFIGLSSGLSWVAWGCKVPVVMISGFTHPTNEFETPYRVINYHTCHSCWNDMRENFDHYDFLWCPRHKGDDRQFECTRLISPEQVIATIKKIPTFKPADPPKKEKEKK